MKRINILLTCLLLCITILSQESNSNDSSKFDNNRNDTIACKLKIIDITKVKKAYIIDALDIKSRNFYKIVSFKGKQKFCNKIRVDKEYELVIWPYFKLENVLPNQIIKNVIEVNGVTITVPSDDCTSNIYLTSDLIGLCYSKSQ